MNSNLKTKTDLLIDNYRESKNALKWQNNYMKNFLGINDALHGRRLDFNRLAEIRDHIKNRTSAWSYYYRNHNLYILSSLLSDNDHYQDVFSDIIEVTEKMKEVHFYKTSSLLLSAYLIAIRVQRQTWDEVIQKARIFRHTLKRLHAWLSTDYDYLASTLFALGTQNPQVVAEAVEDNYQCLRTKGFNASRITFELSQLMLLTSVGKDTFEKLPQMKRCDQIARIRQMLKEEGCRLNGFSLTMLSFVDIPEIRERDLVQKTAETYRYMAGYKDLYGFWHLDRSIKLMLALALVISHYQEEEEGISPFMVTVVANNIASMIQSQQAATASAGAAAAAA